MASITATNYRRQQETAQWQYFGTSGFGGCLVEQEAMEMIEDAIRLHLMDRLEIGEPIGEEIGARSGTRLARSDSSR